MPDRHNLRRRHVVQAWSHLLRGSAVEAGGVGESCFLKLLDATDLVHDRVNALMALTAAPMRGGWAKRRLLPAAIPSRSLRAKASTAAADRLAIGSRGPRTR